MRIEVERAVEMGMNRSVGMKWEGPRRVSGVYGSADGSGEVVGEVRGREGEGRYYGKGGGGVEGYEGVLGRRGRGRGDIGKEGGGRRRSVVRRMKDGGDNRMSMRIVIYFIEI